MMMTGKILSLSGLILTLVIPGSSSLTSSTNFAPSRWFSAAPGLSWLTGYWNGGPDSSAGAPAETPSDPADDETEYDFFENRRVPDRQAHYLYIHKSGARGPSKKSVLSSRGWLSPALPLFDFF